MFWGSGLLLSHWQNLTHGRGLGLQTTHGIPAHLKIFPIDVLLLLPYGDVFVMEWCEISWDSKMKHRKYLLSPGEMKVDPRYRCGSSKAYWLCVEAGVRARCCTPSWSIFRWVVCQVVPEKVRKWGRCRRGWAQSPVLRCAEPLAVAKEEVASCFLSVSTVVWPGWSGLLALEVGSWVIFMSRVSSTV